MILARVVRRLRRIPEPVIGREEALRIAARVAQERRWRWTTPDVSEGLRVWVVQTAADLKPSPWIVIDNQTGEVVAHGSPPR